MLQQLRAWFERERQYGHPVSTELIQDFYIKFLERESAQCKALLVAVGQETAVVKESAIEQGWGSGGEQAMQSDQSQLVLRQALKLQRRQQLLVKKKEQLGDRIAKMSSGK